MPRAYPWRGMARFVAARWWQRHPVHAASAAVQPALQDYARKHPWRLVLGAAGVGSLMLLTRPWRLAPGGWVLRTLITHGVAAGLLLAPRRGASGASGTSAATPRPRAPRTPRKP